MSHWATKFIGLPWAYGARGPHEFDCWNFVRHVQKDHFGIDMPEVDYHDDWKSAAENLSHHEERRNWTQVDKAQEGDVVLMARSRLPVHIGICITANRQSGVIHCVRGQGVVFQPFGSLTVAGWGSLQFYRRVT